MHYNFHEKKNKKIFQKCYFVLEKNIPLSREIKIRNEIYRYDGK
jgi:hypothetical protein